MADADRALSEVRQSLTAYDVLGYLAPGGSILLAILGFEYVIRQLAAVRPSTLHPILAPLHTPVFSTISEVVVNWPKDTSWILDFLALVVVLAASYVIGHIVASVSALAIDRVYIAKGHGYPFSFLLGLPNTNSPYSSNYYRGLFFWFNLYIVLRYLALPYAVPAADFLPEPFTKLFPKALSHEWLSNSAEWIGRGILVVTGLKLLISTSMNTGKRSTYLWSSSLGIGTKRLVEFLLRVIAIPAIAMTNFFGNYLHTRKKLDVETTEAFKVRLARVLGFTPDFASSSPYWFSVLRVRDAKAAIAEPAENWLRLYSFARNLGCAFYLAFLYCYLWWFNEHDTVIFKSESLKAMVFVLPLIMLLLSFVLLLRYYYLYVDYYTKYLVRAFVYLEPALKPGASMPAQAGSPQTPSP